MRRIRLKINDMNDLFSIEPDHESGITEFSDFYVAILKTKEGSNYHQELMQLVIQNQHWRESK